MSLKFKIAVSCWVSSGVVINHAIQTSRICNRSILRQARTQHLATGDSGYSGGPLRSEMKIHTNDEPLRHLIQRPHEVRLNQTK